MSICSPHLVLFVLTTIDSNLLGRTLTHEHLALDFEDFYIDPPEEFHPFLNQKICMENLGYVRQYPYSSSDNLRFFGEDTQTAVLKDIELYRKFGGASIVENTTHGLKRNLKFLATTSQRTGVHIIAGTGHYVHSSQRENQVKLTMEQMAELYTKEILTGVRVESIGMVKCGFIGEVGSIYPLHKFEVRAIAATAAVQETLKCGVSFHPGRNYNAPFEIVRMYLEAGGKANKCVMSHLDRTFDDVEQIFEFAELGTFIQFDLFGTECSLYQLNAHIDMPSDAKRINNLIKLTREGLEDRILISHDIHTKHRLTSFGGHGYHHINMNILPRMLAKGLTENQVEKITITNPAKWLEISI